MKKWQESAVKFARKYELKRSPEVHALDLVSELGEVAKEILLSTNYGLQNHHFSDKINEEIGDLFYSLCLLASSVDVDLESALTTALSKYERRWKEKGNVGNSH